MTTPELPSPFQASAPPAPVHPVGEWVDVACGRHTSERMFGKTVVYRLNSEPESTFENEVGHTIISENDRPEAGCSKDSVSTFSVLSSADAGAPMISAEDVGPLTPEDVRPLKKTESRIK
ncbi:hypothetical protein AVEN_48934-1 [Araneus ventricosus]|uniref:Uncharacterized protein n=1 Tax=Araneus ventricosus TaxID=182803 RepID=A0A4Y2AGV8_ARAVE|nr:hypothetical protein AVEN_48934-1 [Araneus ventricosus]